MTASLAAHLAATLGLSPAAAADAVDAFVEDVYGQCLDRGAAVYPGLGTFRLAASGLAFSPDPALALVVNHRFAGLDAAPATRPETPLPAFAPLAPPAPARAPSVAPSVPVVPVVAAAALAQSAPYLPPAYAAPPPVPPPPPPPTYADLPDTDAPAPRTRVMPAVLVGLMLLLAAMGLYGWWTMRTPAPTVASAAPLVPDTSAAPLAEPVPPATTDTTPPPQVVPAPAAPDRAPVAPAPAPAVSAPSTTAPRTATPRSSSGSRPATRTAVPRESASRALDPQSPPRSAPRSTPRRASLPAAAMRLDPGDALRLTPASERAALVGDAAIEPGADGYTVVAGGAATSLAAERLAEPLRAAGFRVAVLPGTTDGGRTIWRVCVGQFADLGPATAALARLRGTLLPSDAWLLSLRSDRFGT